MKLVFASTNPHKLLEIREILAPFGIDVRGLSEVSGGVPEPVENAPTFEDNARNKAIAYARALGEPCLADDSGVEVDALAGAPGVHSARYAGTGATREERDRDNRNKLLAELGRQGDVSRAARLVCALCFADPTGRVLFEARGSMEAEIAREPRGGNGFGYDSVLFVPDVGKTVAELSAAEMNARSHRGAAVRALHAWLERQRPSDEA
jgi:XTP/dITP diphosphohydrolase